MSNNSELSKNYQSKGLLVKTIELILIICIDIAFFCVLMFSEDLRSAVFGNKYLFILCVIAWSILVITLIFILIDFNLLRTSASETLSLSQAAYNDALTGLPNRHSIDMMLRIQNTDQALENIGCVLIKLSNIGEVNSVFGHEVGDIMIRDFCQMLIAVSNGYGFIGRNGGNDFLGIFENSDDSVMKHFISEMCEQIRIYNLGHITTPIKIEYCYVNNNKEKVRSISDLLTILYGRIGVSSNDDR